MRIGYWANATAELSKTPSNPISIACAAWEGFPIPASTIQGTCLKRARKVLSAVGLASPRPEPIGAPHGIKILQPTSSNRSATTISSVV